MAAEEPDEWFERNNSRIRNNEAGPTKEEYEKQEEKNTTVDAYIVNKAKVKNILDIVMDADRILERNGIKETINYHILTVEEGFKLPKMFNHEDRSLFLALTKQQFASIGASNIHPSTGNLDVWFNNKFLSGIDIEDITSNYKSRWRYALGYTIAHEFAHQLDAFALMSSQGNLKKRGSEGHYGGINNINLLMKGNHFSQLKHKKGGQHELLFPHIKARILQYISK